MDYKNKYLKYKGKYLALKNKKTYVNLKSKFILRGGNPFRVIRNSGSNESGSLTNQCMWFSIRDFLRLNGFPDITIEEVRATAGIGSGYDHVMFDIHNGALRDALQRLINIYNLRIRIFPIEYNGHLSPYWYSGVHGIPRPAEILKPNTGVNVEDIKDVNIAQYGLGHFNLIVGGYGLPEIGGARGEEFIPAIPISTGSGKKTLKEVNKLSLPAEIKTVKLYQKLNDKIDFKNFLLNDIKYETIELEQEKTKLTKTQHSTELSFDEKERILGDLERIILIIEGSIAEKRKAIVDLDSRSEELKLQIKKYEC
jgi:hypothetical protein